MECFLQHPSQEVSAVTEQERLATIDHLAFGRGSGNRFQFRGQDVSLLNDEALGWREAIEIGHYLSRGGQAWTVSAVNVKAVSGPRLLENKPDLLQAESALPDKPSGQYTDLPAPFEIVPTKGFFPKIVGATRRVLNFLSPASRAGKRSCGGESDYKTNERR